MALMAVVQHCILVYVAGNCGPVLPYLPCGLVFVLGCERVGTGGRCGILCGVCHLSVLYMTERGSRAAKHNACGSSCCKVVHNCHPEDVAVQSGSCFPHHHVLWQY
jgi:hypothetical protein